MAFPTTGILDNFNRANEGPPPSANWSGPVVVGESRLVVSANAVQGENATSICSGWWNPSTFGPDSEAFITLVSGGALVAFFGVQLRLAGPNTAGVDGYLFDAAALADELVIYRLDNGVYTQLGVTIAATWANGDALGGEIIGSTLQSYRKPSGGAWGAIGTSRTDATYTAAGFISFRSTGDGTSHVPGDDFGGGTVVTGVTYPGRAAEQMAALLAYPVGSPIRRL